MTELDETGIVPTHNGRVSVDFPLKRFWAPLILVVGAIASLASWIHSKVVMPEIRVERDAAIEREVEKALTDHVDDGVHDGALTERRANERFQQLIDRISPLATQESVDHLQRDVDRLDATVQQLRQQ